MSRSGYTTECDDNLELGRWRGRVKSALRGKRGQEFLRITLAALDAIPDKRLIEENLIDDDREVCTLGAVLVAKGADADKLDPEDHDGLAKVLNVASCLIQEVEYENDEGGWRETPEQRWQRMRQWVARNIRPTESTTT